jgi:hypothetical protein
MAYTGQSFGTQGYGAGQGITAFASQAIKIVYGDLHEQLRDKNPALQFIEASASHITQNGKQVQFDTHVGRNSGIGARGLRENLPSAGAQKYKQANLYLKNLYGTIEVDGQLFEQAAENYQAFINVVDNEIKGLKKDLAQDLNRQVYGDGTGKLATVASVAGAVITVDSTNWLVEGMVISLRTSAGAARGTFTGDGSTGTTPLFVTAINSATTFTVAKLTDGAAPTLTGVVSGDLVLRGSADGAGASTFVDNWNKEWTGLGAIVKATGVLHDIDPATTPVWAAKEYTSVGTLSELGLIQTVQAVDKKGGDVDVFLASPGVFNAYWNLLTGLRRFNDTAALTGGQRSFNFTAAGKDIAFVSDFAAPTGTLYALSSKELVLNRKKDWSWMDRDGSMWTRSNNTDAYKAVLYQYSELGTYRRNAHAVMTGITEAGNSY